MKRIGVVIGRFQPIHLGHEKLVSTALLESDAVVVVMGSAGKAPTVKNPWSDLERLRMFSTVFTVGKKALKPWTDGELNVDGVPINFVKVSDHGSDEAWVVDVEVALARYVSPEDHVTLFVGEKDKANYYWNMFPEWNVVPVDSEVKAKGKVIDATTVREALFSGKAFKQYVSEGVAHYLSKWAESPLCSQMQREDLFIKKYKDAWSSAPYPPVFVTVDGVVVHKNRVLMIRRKAEPGRGLLALPGGFINQNERLFDGVIREVLEETGLKLKKEWCRGSRVFDAPDRSLRGRTITHAFRFEVPEALNFDVVAGDDADKAMWVATSHAHLYGERMFEDHDQIVREMLNV